LFWLKAIELNLNPQTLLLILPFNSHSLISGCAIFFCETKSKV
jgi:hypothetical protein